MRGGWVLDSTLALAFGLPGERTTKADKFLAGVGDGFDAWVPALWWYEISNALRMAKRRKRVSDSQLARLLELYSRLPLRTDTLAASGALQRCTEFFEERGFCSYDVAYLELAARRGLGLATLDARLAKAARKIGVKVWK